ncbi:transposase [Paractinoplanes deccanensis]|uniref:transposase n=1 Tax=Paractinoplanes deccanensis TaxID=113561 RepID=UPI001943B135|nr:transposase [Actinoplanes deccanensis]
MALVRVYCGLASADESVRGASSPQLTIAVVDDAGRLLGVHEIGDDPGGYAELGSLLVERTSGFTDAAVAADSDDHLVTSLLTAAGRPLVVADDDTTDDFAERFADDDSVEEMQAPPAARRAVGLARALQAGALTASGMPVSRELVSYKPVLAAHVALLNGRHAAASALREVLRELYPAALRAYPDPAHPLALAVLDALPEPGRLTAQGDTERAAEQVASELTRAGAGTEDEIIAAVTALHVAISESPRRGGINKSLAPAAGETVRQAVAAVRSCDAACASLIGTIAARSTPSTGAAGVGRRAARRSPEPAPLQSVSAFGRRGRPEPASTGSGPASPQPLTSPPVAPDPIGPPPIAPRPSAPAAAFPNRAPSSRPVSAPSSRPVSAPSSRPVSGPGNKPVSVPPPPPGMTPITPGSRPVPGSRNPAASASPSGPSGSGPSDSSGSFPAVSRPSGSFPAASGAPGSFPAASGASGQFPGTGASGAFPASRPSGSLPAGTPTSGSFPVASPTSGSPFPPETSAAPSSGAPGGATPAESGQPFRATLTNAAINNARAERQRTVIPPRPSTRPASSTPASTSATDYSLPMPAQRPGGPEAEPGSRANWPLLNNGGSDDVTPAASTSSPPSDGRVRPPWQDMPKEPPALRLVEGNSLDATVTDLPAATEPPALRLVEGDARRNGTRRTPTGTAAGPALTALDRSISPPVPADSNDGDLLIFAQARSAWFTGHTEQSDKLDWTNPNDTGWRAAEKAATPEVAAETSAGLPKRVPQANLVPGSPLRDERPLRIVRDAASIAAHTTGYFRGWRRGQEIGGFAMGGRPGRESAGGWDFTRDGQGDGEYRNNNSNSNNNAGYGSR